MSFLILDLENFSSTITSTSSERALGDNTSLNYFHWDQPVCASVSVSFDRALVLLHSLEYNLVLAGSKNSITFQGIFIGSHVMRFIIFCILPPVSVSFVWRACHFLVPRAEVSFYFRVLHTAPYFCTFFCIQNRSTHNNLPFLF